MLDGMDSEVQVMKETIVFQQLQTLDKFVERSEVQIEENTIEFPKLQKVEKSLRALGAAHGENV